MPVKIIAAAWVVQTDDFTAVIGVVVRLLMDLSSWKTGIVNVG